MMELFADTVAIIHSTDSLPGSPFSLGKVFVLVDRVKTVPAIVSLTSQTIPLHEAIQ